MISTQHLICANEDIYWFDDECTDLVNASKEDQLTLLLSSCCVSNGSAKLVNSVLEGSQLTAYYCSRRKNHDSFVQQACIKDKTFTDACDIDSMVSKCFRIRTRLKQRPCDAYVIACFLAEIQRSFVLRRALIKKLRDFSSKTKRSCVPVSENDIHLVVQLEWPTNLPVFKAWSWRIMLLVLKKQSLEETMIWLSTLGGAYSAMGNYYIRYAEIAGKISVQQLQVALQMGDPISIAKCRIYIAVSLMQRGRLKDAKKITRSQWLVGKRSGDNQLKRMCLGVWSRLSHLIKKNAQLL